MNPNSKIYIAGHRGMVGSAILRNLTSNGFHNIITKTSEELDLTDQKKVQTFFETEKPEYVFLAAAKVGGIVANRRTKEQFRQNERMQSAGYDVSKEGLREKINAESYTNKINEDIGKIVIFSSYPFT